MIQLLISVLVGCIAEGVMVVRIAQVVNITLKDLEEISSS